MPLPVIAGATAKGLTVSSSSILGIGRMIGAQNLSLKAGVYGNQLSVKSNQDTIKKINNEVKTISNLYGDINTQREKQLKTAERVRQTNSFPRFVSSTALQVGNLLKRVIEAPVKALQSLLLGLLIFNLPKIIQTVQDTINRFKIASRLIKSYLSTAGNIINNSWGIINAIYQNVVNFDFNDESRRYQNAIDDYNKDLEADTEQIEDLRNAFNLNSEDLQKYIDQLEGKASPNVEPQTPAVGEGASTTPSTTATGGSAEDYRIAAAIASESGPGQSAVDVLQVAANRVASSAYPNNFTDVFAQSGQFEGVFSRSVSEFKAISSAEDAARWLGGGATPDLIERYINDLRNPEYRRKAANDIAGAVQFRANPSYYRENGLVPGQMNTQGRFTDSFYRGGRGDNQFFTTPGDQGAGTTASPLPAIGRSTTPSTPSQTPPRATATPRNNTGVIDELDVATDKSPLGGLTPGQGFGVSRPGGRVHQGIDIGTYQTPGFRVAFRGEGKVALISNDPTGYGKFVIITIPSMNMSFMFAHLKEVYVRVGESYFGQAIGEIGRTGNSPYIHLHFEAYIGGANGKAIDPAPYIGYLSIGRQLRTKDAAKISSSISPLNLSSPINSNDIASSLYYDEEAMNMNTEVVLMQQPIIATQPIMMNMNSSSQSTPVINLIAGNSNNFNSQQMALLG